MYQKENPAATSLFRKAVKMRGMTMEDLAHDALIPKTTLYRRLAHPSTLTIANLRNIFDALGADADEALGIVGQLLWEGVEWDA